MAALGKRMWLAQLGPSCTRLCYILQTMAAKFQKHDSGKSRLDLLPARALDLVGHVLGHGGRIYGDENWRKCPDARRFIAASMRHTNKHLQGELVDPETGAPHLASAAASALLALELVLLGSYVHPEGSALAIVKLGRSRARVVAKFRDMRDFVKAFERLRKLGPGHTIMACPAEKKIGSFLRIG